MNADPLGQHVWYTLSQGPRIVIRARGMGRLQRKASARMWRLFAEWNRLHARRLLAQQHKAPTANSRASYATLRRYWTHKALFIDNAATLLLSCLDRTLGFPLERIHNETGPAIV